MSHLYTQHQPSKLQLPSAHTLCFSLSLFNELYLIQLVSLLVSLSLLAEPYPQAVNSRSANSTP